MQEDMSRDDSRERRDSGREVADGHVRLGNGDHSLLSIQSITIMKYTMYILLATLIDRQDK